MKIAYGKNQSTYVTTLKSFDCATNSTSNTILEEVAPPSGFACTHYQNLCCSYLEPYICSKTDNKLITKDFIQTKSNNFINYFKSIKYIFNRKITILGKKITCYDETDKRPKKTQSINNEYKER